MKQDRISEIKVLNIAQPNAHKVFFGGKNVENRSTPSSFRGTIAIYASKTYSADRFEGQEVRKEDCTFGCIIGLVDIVDCIIEDQVTEKTKTWFQGAYGYVFENIRIFAQPIEVRPPQGAVIWWTLSGPQLDECLAQTSDHEIKPIQIVPADQRCPVVKTAGRAKLIPSEPLAQIVGTAPLSFKKAANLIFDYIDDKNLFVEPDIIKTDRILENIFGKKEIKAQEFKEIVLKNLKVA